MVRRQLLQKKKPVRCSARLNKLNPRPKLDIIVFQKLSPIKKSCAQKTSSLKTDDGESTNDFYGNNVLVSERCSKDTSLLNMKTRRGRAQKKKGRSRKNSKDSKTSDLLKTKNDSVSSVKIPLSENCSEFIPLSTKTKKDDDPNNGKLSAQRRTKGTNNDDFETQLLFGKDVTRASLLENGSNLFPTPLNQLTKSKEGIIREKSSVCSGKFELNSPEIFEHENKTKEFEQPALVNSFGNDQKRTANNMTSDEEYVVIEENSPSTIHERRQSSRVRSKAVDELCSLFECCELAPRDFQKNDKLSFFDQKLSFQPRYDRKWGFKRELDDSGNLQLPNLIPISETSWSHVGTDPKMTSQFHDTNLPDLKVEDAPDLAQILDIRSILRSITSIQATVPDYEPYVEGECWWEGFDLWST